MNKTLKRYHPGLYLKDSLESLQMSNKEFALRTGISERTLSDLINGKGDITFDIAYKLSLYFGTSINVWTNLQNSYDEYLRSIENEKSISEDYEYIKSLKKYLLKLNVIEDNDSKELIVNKVRKYIGVNKISYLETSNLFICFNAENKEGKSSFERDFWIILALQKAREFKTKPYDKKRLMNSIDKLKTLMNLEPEEFLPKIKNILSECGVNYIYLPYLPKSNIYGATKWFDNSVMLAMSSRSDRADIFWFTLFHEIAHVLKERKRYIVTYIGDDIDSEADKFSEDSLINPKELNIFLDNKNINESSILKFAKKEKVPPFIVVGRLEKEKRIQDKTVFSHLMELYQI